MKPFRLGAVLLAATLVSVACSTTPTESTNKSALDQIIERGTIRVGVIVNWVPLGFNDPSGELVGYEVDQANALAKALGVKLEMVPTTAADRIPNLLTNKIDVMIGLFTPTLERSKSVAFTQPFIIDALVVGVPADSSIQSISDLAGKTVAVTKGTTEADQILQIQPAAKPIQFDDTDTSVLAVKQGQADAVFESQLFMMAKATTDTGLNLRFLSGVAFKENEAWGLRRGDPEWKAYLNEFLYLQLFDGTNDQLFDKWFKGKVPFPLPYSWY